VVGIAVRDMQLPKFDRAKYSVGFKELADEQRAKGKDSFSAWYKKLDGFHKRILTKGKRNGPT